VTIDFNGRKLHRSEYDEVVRDIARYIKDRLKIEQSAAAFGSLEVVGGWTRWCEESLVQSAMSRPNLYSFLSAGTWYNLDNEN
jgi:hypothetical protein